ncbi:hypothetical protein [[Acholeplasma] multilocale]|uniref:hypothetical protein n=1 Tax=[Acholeplasma] multilocale TaxID=264638 RepID=UPI00047DCF35|nr:hypothetical protein [[Acholeplasma] multilocale]
MRKNKYIEYAYSILIIILGLTAFAIKPLHAIATKDSSYSFDLKMMEESLYYTNWVIGIMLIMATYNLCTIHRKEQRLLPWLEKTSVATGLISFLVYGGLLIKTGHMDSEHLGLIKAIVGHFIMPLVIVVHLFVYTVKDSKNIAPAKKVFYKDAMITLILPMAYMVYVIGRFLAINATGDIIANANSEWNGNWPGSYRMLCPDEIGWGLTLGACLLFLIVSYGIFILIEVLSTLSSNFWNRRDLSLNSKRKLND